MTALAGTLQAFFTDRLIRQRQASGNTIAAYRDGLRLLLVFASDATGTPASRLDIAALAAPLIGAFLDHLEHGRGNSVRTRNARLAAIHALFGFAALRHPEHADTIARVLAIGPKNYDRTIVTYLTDDQATALLAAPDPSTWTGRRDHALLTLAVHTGHRASELIALTGLDLHLAAGAHVACHGKGRKDRITPLSPATVAALRPWLAERGGQQAADVRHERLQPLGSLPAGGDHGPDRAPQTAQPLQNPGGPAERHVPPGRRKHRQRPRPGPEHNRRRGERRIVPGGGHPAARTHPRGHLVLRHPRRRGRRGLHDSRPAHRAVRHIGQVRPAAPALRRHHRDGLVRVLHQLPGHPRAARLLARLTAGLPAASPNSSAPACTANPTTATRRIRGVRHRTTPQFGDLRLQRRVIRDQPLIGLPQAPGLDQKLHAEPNQLLVAHPAQIRGHTQTNERSRTTSP